MESSGSPPREAPRSNFTPDEYRRAVPALHRLHRRRRHLPGQPLPAPRRRRRPPAGRHLPCPPPPQPRRLRGVPPLRRRRPNLARSFPAAPNSSSASAAATSPLARSRAPAPRAADPAADRAAADELAPQPQGPRGTGDDRRPAPQRPRPRLPIRLGPRDRPRPAREPPDRPPPGDDRPRATSARTPRRPTCCGRPSPAEASRGPPKIRAMEIIDELEGVARGCYTGSIGIACVTGVSEWNIAIRTILCDGSTAYVPVGGGIVADSTPPGRTRRNPRQSPRPTGGHRAGTRTGSRALSEAKTRICPGCHGLPEAHAWRRAGTGFRKPVAPQQKAALPYTTSNGSRSVCEHVNGDAVEFAGQTLRRGGSA